MANQASEGLPYGSAWQTKLQKVLRMAADGKKGWIWSSAGKGRPN
jgi:hypothetical protein